MTKNVIVNATALDNSGAVTILQQFLAAIPPGHTRWIMFISDKIHLIDSRNQVRLIPVSHVKSLPRRFLWDMFGLKKRLKREGIRPTASLSFQNTGFRTGYSVPAYIYYHQSIPFFEWKWSFFRREERTLWFYKNIYPFFVRLLLHRQTEIFVQLYSIKEKFVEKYKVLPSRVHVISPTVKLPDMQQEAIVPASLPENQINIFYPATPFLYKNHKVVVEALKRLDRNAYSLYLTVDKNSFFSPESFIRFMGKISYREVIAMYAAVDVMVFPSYIETYGLPLIEAASLGVPILAADLPYAREVLGGYEGVTFIDYSDPEAWKNELMKIRKQVRYTPYKPLVRPSWSALFERIEKS